MIFNFDENNAFEYENGFMLTSETYRLGNILSHFELYKMIIDKPGSVVELGVFKGNSLIQFATFRELLENENSRKIIGFDIFGEFPESKAFSSDEKFVSNWNELFKGEIPTEKDLQSSLDHKGVKNVELVKGNILETLPVYLKENPHLKISLLHIDTDVYEPSKLALELLFDCVVPGGLIVLDDYGTVEGETKAVDEFFVNKNYEIKKFPFSHTKPSFIIK